MVAQNRHVQTDMSKLVYMSLVSVAWYFCDSNAICYVLPVLSTTSCFHIIGHVMYGEAYCRGMSVSGRQRREGRSASASASASPLTTLLPAVLPGFWMTSCFHIIGQIQIQRRSELFTVIRQVAPMTDIGHQPVTANNALCARGRTLLFSLALFDTKTRRPASADRTARAANFRRDLEAT